MRWYSIPRTRAPGGVKLLNPGIAPPNRRNLWAFSGRSNHSNIGMVVLKAFAAGEFDGSLELQNAGSAMDSDRYAADLKASSALREDQWLCCMQKMPDTYV